MQLRGFEQTQELRISRPIDGRWSDDGPVGLASLDHFTFRCEFAAAIIRNWCWHVGLALRFIGSGRARCRETGNVDDTLDLWAATVHGFDEIARTYLVYRQETVGIKGLGRACAMDDV